MYKNYSDLGIAEEKNRDQYSVLDITDDNQKSSLMSQNQLLVVEIYADWCGPCKQISPDFAMVANRFNKPGICLVSKQQYDKLSPKENQTIQSIPYFQYFMNGKQVDSTVGANIQEVTDKITKLLESSTNKVQNSTENFSQGPHFSRNNIRNYKPNNELLTPDSKPKNYQGNQTGNYYQTGNY